jgi:hypothetical protein
MPSSAATSCPIAVSLPDPGDDTPVRTVASPDGLILTVAVSKPVTKAPGMSALSGVSSKPSPTPSRRPSASARSCSARSSR